MAPRERLWAQLWAIGQMRMNMQSGRAPSGRKEVRMLTSVERRITEALMDAYGEQHGTLRSKLIASLQDMAQKLENTGIPE